MYSFNKTCRILWKWYMYICLLQVRLICNDGTRYTKDVDIVRKCACTKKCYWLTDAAIHNSNTQPLEPATVDNQYSDTIERDRDLTSRTRQQQQQTDIMRNLDDSSQRVLQPVRVSSAHADNKQPLKLTFFVSDEENDTDKHLNDASSVDSSHHASNAHHPSRYYFPDRDENNPDVRVAKLARDVHHDSYCLLSAFLYFTTITSFTYLLVIWIKQKMHIQMEVLHWWWTKPVK